jgi:hypothetical protein
MPVKAKYQHLEKRPDKRAQELFIRWSRRDFSRPVRLITHEKERVL